MVVKLCEDPPGNFNNLKFASAVATQLVPSGERYTLFSGLYYLCCPAQLHDAGYHMDLGARYAVSC